MEKYTQENPVEQESSVESRIEKSKKILRQLALWGGLLITPALVSGSEVKEEVHHHGKTGKEVIEIANKGISFSEDYVVFQSRNIDLIENIKEDISRKLYEVGLRHVWLYNILDNSAEAAINDIDDHDDGEYVVVYAPYKRHLDSLDLTGEFVEGLTVVNIKNGDRVHREVKMDLHFFKNQGWNDRQVTLNGEEKSKFADMAAHEIADAIDQLKQQE